MNPGDSKQFSADHSQFRRRLMECLQKPFDQQECDGFLDSVRKQTQMERHIELRGGVNKPYHVSGTVNKSYLELNPGRSILSSIPIFQIFLSYMKMVA